MRPCLAMASASVLVVVRFRKAVWAQQLLALVIPLREDSWGRRVPAKVAQLHLPHPTGELTNSMT